MHGEGRRCLRHPALQGRNSSFMSYVTWFESVQGALLVRTGDDIPLFPCVLPFPEILTLDFVFGAEQATVWWAKAFVNTFVAWSNFVVLGCPKKGSSAYEPRVLYRADIQVFAEELLGEVVEFASVEMVTGSLSLEGKRSLLEDLMKQTCASYGVQVAAPSGALPVAAERVAIPKNAGAVDPLDWLPADQAATVAGLEELRLPEHLWEDVVTACHRVPEDQEAELARQLLETKMAVLVPENDLPRDSRGQLLTGGLFCVAKNETEDRLIFDRRPENATMHRLAWERLPSGACFTRMLLGDKQFLRGSGDDLRNFYYTLRLPDSWIRYNSVGRPVDPKVVKEFGGDAAKVHRLCFRVLGMGDRNGCSIAQATHEAILRAHGLLSPTQTLVYGRHVPDDDLWQGVYIDDLLVTLRLTLDRPVPLDGSFIPPEPQASDRDMQCTRQAEEAYRNAGLERAAHKAFRGEVRFKAWGAEVDGVGGTVGAPLAVRREIWLLISRCVRAGRASKAVLQKLVGFLAFAFQFRRELFCLMHRIYVFVAGLPEDRVMKLPAYILDELRALALHLPFARWKMRRRLHPTILATDATPSSGGAVRAKASQALLQELWRRSEMRGAPLRLDRSNLDLSGHAPLEVSHFAAAISECLPWYVTGSYHFRQTSHINLQEARALRREVIKMSSCYTHRGTIQVCFNDSLVVCGAISKGRSSSYRLNGVLRAQLPFLIMADLVLALLWIETESNFADHPSRFRPLPSPSRPSAWMARFGPGSDRLPVGWEIFAGTAPITLAYRGLGWKMLEPVEILTGTNAFDPEIDRRIRDGEVDWLWLSPPYRSFSALRHLARGGPLRPAGDPEGDPSDARIQLGNALWERALELAELICQAGGNFILEHPRDSKAWQLRSTEVFMRREGVRRHRLDMCAYHGGPEPPAQKPTILMSNFGWLPACLRFCPANHEHGERLRGARARAAGAYPWGFAEAVANQHAKEVKASA